MLMAVIRRRPGAAIDLPACRCSSATSRIPDLPIYLDSPMACDATAVYRQHREDHDLSEGELDDANPVLAGPQVHLCPSTDESKALNHITGPAVIISSSGMMDAGRIVHHLKYRLPQSKNTIVLGGFMAVGTRGRLLQDGAKSLRMHGQEVPVRAAIEKVPGLSGHADRSHLLRWLEPLPPPKQLSWCTASPAGRGAWPPRSAASAAGMSRFPISANRTNWCNVRRRLLPAPCEHGSPSMKQQDTAEANRQAILNSPSYRLAEYDFDFLKRDDIRHVRMTLELLKTETLLRDNNVKATVVVFGSARIVPQEVAEVATARGRPRCEEASARSTCQAGHRTGPSGSSPRAISTTKPASSAGSFRRSARSKARNDFVIATGGGPGIMEAANRGAFEVGAQERRLQHRPAARAGAEPVHHARSLLPLPLFRDSQVSLHPARKALVVFPGGFGTLDELFDTLCLRQTRRMQAIPIILYGREYWDSIIDFPKMADEGVIDDDDLKLIS